MPFAKLRQDFVPLPASRPTPQLTGNIEGIAPAPSPARALQQQLEYRALQAQKAEKWSQRRALGFIVVSSCALWMALLIAGTAITGMVA